VKTFIDIHPFPPPLAGEGRVRGVRKTFIDNRKGVRVKIEEKP